MNTPFTHQQVKSLPLGYTPTRVFLGMQKDQFGNDIPVFYPNRRERRAAMKPRKVKSTQIVIFGTQKPKDTDVILKTYSSDKGEFYHVKRKIRHHD